MNLDQKGAIILCSLFVMEVIMHIVAILTFCILLIYVIKNRSNILAGIAIFKYGRGDADGGLKLYKFADKIGKLKFDHKVMRAYLTLKEGDVDEANKLFNLIGMEKLKPEQRAKLKESHALVAWKRGEVAEAIEMLEYVHNHYVSTTILVPIALLISATSGACKSVGNPG